MNTILFIGIFQALFLFLLVINKKRKSQSDWILLFMLIYMALNQAFFLANFNEEVKIPLPLMILGGGFPLLYGPILYWYVLSLIREKPVQARTFVIHSIIYLLFVVLFSIYHYLIEGYEVSVYDGYLHIHGNYPLLIRLYSVYFAISGGVYPLICLILLQLHKQKIHRQFSYEEEINLDWLKLLIVGTFASFLAGFFTILFIVDWQWNENPRYAFYIISIINTVFIFFMGYFDLKQTTIFDASEVRTRILDTRSKVNEEIESRYSKSGLDTDKSKELFEKLNNAMKQDKFYLDGKLTLASLASKMNVSTNHVSQAINENSDMNFFDYVNSYRVKEVKELIMNINFSHYTLLGIGIECGFNSKSSFNQIFKEHTGMTPSQYKRSLTS